MNFPGYFDLDPQIIYLNSGTHSIVPRQTLLRVREEAREYERNPTVNLIQAWGRVCRVNTRVAEFFGANAADFFLAPSVTAVLNRILLGWRLQAGAEILLSDQEYGAVDRILRLRAEQSGVVLKRFTLAEPGASETEIVESVLRELNGKTKLVVLSHILMGSGRVLPIAAIGRGLAAQGVPLVIDGAHAPGALPLQLGSIDGVSAYAGSLHKWMTGPKGTSFGWVRPEFHDFVATTMGGWSSSEPPEIFSVFGPPGNFALRMFDTACYDFSPFFALETTLDLWREWGPERVRARLLALRSHLDQEVQNRLALKPTLTQRSLESPLLSYQLPAELEKIGPKLITKWSEEFGLVVGIPWDRNTWRLRLSPHIYNTETELSRGVDLLQEACENAAAFLH